MTDIISLECIAEAEPGAISPDVYRGALIKALTAIKELVAERDRLLLEADPELPTIAYMTGAHDWKVRRREGRSRPRRRTDRAA